MEEDSEIKAQKAFRITVKKELENFEKANSEDDLSVNFEGDEELQNAHSADQSLGDHEISGFNDRRLSNSI